MPTRLLGWPPAVLATVITVALVAGELTDAGQRRWWSARPLTTDTVAGLLVLLITVLVVNQLLNRRQARQRGHAVAAQAAAVPRLFVIEAEYALALLRAERDWVLALADDITGGRLGWPRSPRPCTEE